MQHRKKTKHINKCFNFKSVLTFSPSSVTNHLQCLHIGSFEKWVTFNGLTTQVRMKKRAWAQPVHQKTATWEPPASSTRTSENDERKREWWYRGTNCGPPYRHSAHWLLVRTLLSSVRPLRCGPHPSHHTQLANLPACLSRGSSYPTIVSNNLSIY
jgi:hypothetical protein